MSKTTIGINGAVLAAKRHGISRYVARLLDGFESIDTGEFEFTVFTDTEVESTPSTRTIGIDRSGTLDRVLWDTIHFARTAQRTGVDAVHAPDKGPLISPDCPVVTTIHDLLPYLYPNERAFANRTYWKLSLRRQAHLSDIVIAVSESTKQDLTELFDIDESKVHVTHLGTDFSPPPKPAVDDVVQTYDIPVERFTVLYVGNYDERKNVGRVVDACRVLDERGLDIQLVLAGSNPPKAQLAERAGDFGERISFLGYVPDGKLEALYGAADVFVYPSIYEGFGLPALEAMACGTPVVTSNSSSLPEVVGDAGITIDPEETPELVDAIERVQSDASVRAEMRRDGLRRADRMTWKRTARETINAYEKLKSI